MEKNMSIDSGRMEKAPVYFALAQVRFTPVKAMSKYIDEIQDVLRLEGYPLFEKREESQIKFEFKGPNQAPEPTFDTITRWYMTNVESTAGFVLSNDFITFQTTDYETHKPFFQTIMKGLNVVIEHAKPSLIRRLGIRYLDAVMPEDNENVDKYLADGLHGVNSGLNLLQAVNEMAFQTTVGPVVKDGILAAKVYKVNSELAFPPDVVPYGISMLPKFSNVSSRWHCCIDTDHYVEGNMRHNEDEIFAQFLSLHGLLKSTFKNMVSEYALRKWK